MISMLKATVSKQRVLIIDDEMGWRHLLAFELEPLGYEVVTARDGIEGKSILREGPFDLIITDIRMPGEVDGIELIQSYWEEHPSQKVIFITGYATEEKLYQALERGQGVCRLLKKPFGLEELSRSIFQLLEKKNSQEHPS